MLLAVSPIWPIASFARALLWSEELIPDLTYAPRVSILIAFWISDGKIPATRPMTIHFQFSLVISKRLLCLIGANRDFKLPYEETDTDY